MKTKFRIKGNTYLDENYLFSNSSFLNSQNYISSKRRDISFSKFYYSLIEKDEQFRMYLIFLAVIVEFLLVVLLALTGIDIMSVYGFFIFTILPIFLVIFLPFKGLNLIYYSYFKGKKRILYNGIYSIDLIKMLYNRNTEKIYSEREKKIEAERVLNKHFISKKI